MASYLLVAGFVDGRESGVNNNRQKHTANEWKQSSQQKTHGKKTGLLLFRVWGGVIALKNAVPH